MKAERTGAALIARARMIFEQRGIQDFTATHYGGAGRRSVIRKAIACARVA